MSEGGGRGWVGWIVFIAILGVVNLMSWLFDWSFWLY